MLWGQAGPPECTSPSGLLELAAGSTPRISLPSCSLLHTPAGQREADKFTASSHCRMKGGTFHPGIYQLTVCLLGTYCVLGAGSGAAGLWASTPWATREMGLPGMERGEAGYVVWRVESTQMEPQPLSPRRSPGAAESPFPSSGGSAN